MEPTRIGGILACADALSLIHDYIVDKQDCMPTHAFVAVKLSRSAAGQTRNFARSLPTFKTMSERNLTKQGEEKKKERGKEESKEGRGPKKKRAKEETSRNHG